MSRIEITEEVTKEEWESFLLKQNTPPFLQSWNMIDVYAGIGDQSLHIAVRQDGEIVGGSIVEVVRARRGAYVYLPYGPVFTPNSWTYFGELTDYLISKGRDLGVDFIRSSPFLGYTAENKELYARAGWKRSPIHMLAEHVWWLDITSSEEDIMRGMRKTMRNSIRRAEKANVTIRMSTDIKDVEEFINIHRDTVTRHKFTPYSNTYFRSQMKSFLHDDHVALFLAEFRGRTIAAAMIMFYGNMASYHHGASLTQYVKIPSSYLLQWTAIQEAKRRGCEKYNFWGVVPKGKELSPILKRKHPFAGVTTFKTGFGGEQFDLLHCQDYPLSMKYNLFTKPIEIARRYKRGFFY